MRMDVRAPAKRHRWREMLMRSVQQRDQSLLHITDVLVCDENKKHGSLHTDVKP